MSGGYPDKNWAVESGATAEERHNPRRRTMEFFDSSDEASRCLNAHGRAGRSAAMARTDVFAAEAGSQ